jgi:hypothetical protein
LSVRGEHCGAGWPRLNAEPMTAEQLGDRLATALDDVTVAELLDGLPEQTDGPSILPAETALAAEPGTLMRWVRELALGAERLRRRPRAHQSRVRAHRSSSARMEVHVSYPMQTAAERAIDRAMDETARALSPHARHNHQTTTGRMPMAYATEATRSRTRLPPRP